MRWRYLGEMSRMYCGVVISSAQCRAARALLGMTQSDLAAAAGVSAIVIMRFEKGSDPRASTVNAIERALIAAGVTLIDDGAASPAGAGPGVRLTHSSEGGLPP
jgi:transcriptional regulator with XRE-family HTH domain